VYLKSLTLKGFKSFASTTTLKFEPGITCVVGPNGTGKSNVVDALSWVMGEQGAKSLRGGKMEDVIFAGTAVRAPLGRAEVILTIDNSDGALPIEYGEVTISRTMFRNGGSEYEINGNKARLLDVQELLSDSGIGREMHVIVGQGQLDSILAATPEMRRGFIEEAAGVLKHRKRKEKALRKLEATQANMNRLSDLVAEVRRQLKPLSRQAEVARKAAVIQSEARDARSRLFADDLVQAEAAMQSDLADEAEVQRRRGELESALQTARADEHHAEETARSAVPRLNTAQDTWYALSGLRERVASTISIANERVRNAGAATTQEHTGPDPDELEAEAEKVGTEEAALRDEIAHKSAALDTATAQRRQAEDAHEAEENRVAALLRAAADRREGRARLTGQVNSLRSRSQAAAEEISRLTAALSSADDRAQTAKREFTALETRVASLDDGESGLDAEHEAAEDRLNTVAQRLSELTTQESDASSERSAVAARLEALQLGLDRKDGSAALLAATDRVDHLLGSVAALVSIEPGFEAAVSAAFGSAADAVAVTDTDAALAALDLLSTEDLGRAGLLLSAAPEHDGPADWPALPAGVCYAADAVDCGDELRPAVNRALRKVAVTDRLDTARQLVDQIPDLTAVTKNADMVSAHFVAGGSARQPSLIEVQAAVDEATQHLDEVTRRCERLRFTRQEAAEEHIQAQQQVDYAMARLHESDAEMAALAEELGQQNAATRSAGDEADRLRTSITEAEQARDQDMTGLAELEARLEEANRDQPDDDPDHTESDRLADQARSARSAETDARLALRTAEERARGLSGRSEELQQAAEAERNARGRAQQRRERLAREAQRAAAVATGGQYLADKIDASIELAAAQRCAAESARAEADETLTTARQTSRETVAQLESLVEDAHQDEMLRAQRRMHRDSLAEKAMAELGTTADTLTREFGPEVPIPVLTDEHGNALDRDATAAQDLPEPVPYVRAEQEKRLRKADRSLAQLGKVNPLALEEYAAMEERHAFLSEQAEDLHKTSQDLRGIISDVDFRVEQVFADAYSDVAQAFERVFARLFPGGSGKLVLTEPENWLTTGVDVEAKPAGKNVKRLSLLSGGERSLVAAAFLVSLFIARPSPFYILDEVEAALDDTNLSRLLDIYAELRESSQLLVITHQKRTMEIGDALYGVTMQGDGVSTVISQRLRDSDTAA
jgi:chromosome segregation protein